MQYETVLNILLEAVYLVLSVAVLFLLNMQSYTKSMICSLLEDMLAKIVCGCWWGIEYLMNLLTNFLIFTIAKYQK